MCIIKTEAWAYAGTNYTTEKDAVKAALTDIGTRLIKEFHSNPLQGLLTLGAEVSELRDRYMTILDRELQAEKGIPEKVEPPFSAEYTGPAGGDPADPLSSTNMVTRFLDIPDHSPIFDAVQVWVKRHHYRSFEEAIQRSRDSERLELSNLIGIAKKPEPGQ